MSNNNNGNDDNNNRSNSTKDCREQHGKGKAAESKMAESLVVESISGRELKWKRVHTNGREQDGRSHIRRGVR